MAQHEEPDGTVRVWESIGMTIPVGDPSQYAFLKIELGHERLSPSNKPKDVDETYRLVRERNNKMVAKRVKELRRQMKGKK